ncbi:hypothetical protein GCM10027456_81900 [Kineosporia babensis]
MTDLAVTIADGGRFMSDLAVLRDQGELFGSVASDTTAWRMLNGLPLSACGTPPSRRSPGWLRRTK